MLKTIASWLPQEIKNMIRFYIINIYHRRKGAIVKSSFVSLDAQLGKGVEISHDAVVEGTVTIGDYSYVMNYTSVISAQIGKYCAIGCNCHIGGWEHPMSNITISPKIYRNILKRASCLQRFATTCKYRE